MDCNESSDFWIRVYSRENKNFSDGNQVCIIMTIEDTMPCTKRVVT